MRFQDFELPELGGLDESENPHRLLPTSLEASLNSWVLGGATGTRPGTIMDPDEDYAEAIASGPTICGIADFRRSRDSARDLVAVIPGAIHTDDGTTLDIATNSVDVTNAVELPWTFAQHKNILFAAGGDPTTSDMAWYWDPSIGAGDVITPLGILNLSSAGVEPRYIHQWNNRLYAAGFDESDESANPGVIRASALNDGTVWPVEDTIGGNFSVGGFAADAEEYLTGLNSFSIQARRWLLGLTNKRIYLIEENASTAAQWRVAQEIPHGVVNHNAFVNLGLNTDAIFLSETGIHSLRQSQDPQYDTNKFLSWNIRQTFDTINWSRAAYIVGAYWRRYGVVVFAVPTGSSTQNDTILMLDLKTIRHAELNSETARWHVWRLAGTDHHASYLASGRSEDGKSQLYWGDYGGRVGTFTAATYSDLGTGYQFNIQTKHSHFGRGTREKVFGDFYADIGPGGSYEPQFQAIFDFGREPQQALNLQMPAGDSFILGTGILGVTPLGAGSGIFRNKVYVTGRGDVVSFKLSHSGVNEPVYLHGLFGQVATFGEGADS